ncbi:MAG: hypothetical protein JO316_20965 [Abitibacteriaceae bacterium]|nr:hypothetical protein [Abditibacteriaceae bacterium]
MAGRIALAALVLCVVVATLRSRFGDIAPWPPERPLRIMMTGFTAPNFQPRAQLQEVPVGWLQTFGAVLAFAGNLAQQVGPKGAIWLVVLMLLGVAAWWLLAHLGEWRKPLLPLCILIVLQSFGAVYYLSSFLTPSRRLVTPFTAFDFHTHTLRSNGLLTPQQQIDWHRARGFAGLAFTDSNTLMPVAEISALRAANPDMLLLNGCEYHGDAHLVLLGLKSAISARDMSVADAIKAARRQGAMVIVAHPWSPAKYSIAQLIQMGVDGFEGWNGVIWSHEVAQVDKQRHLIATTATDTLSKSGSRCFTWTLLPRGLNNPDKVLRALRLRKTAAAFALNDDDTPETYDQRQARLKHLSGLPLAVRAAWGELAPAQRINALLGLLGLISLLVAWGAASGRPAAMSLGPSRAVDFLRRRRLVGRLSGCLLMLLAFLGSIDAALLTMGATFKATAPVKTNTLAHLTPLHAIVAWIILDGLYLYGRILWQRTR